MANICNNFLQAFGEEAEIKKLDAFLRGIFTEESKEDAGVLMFDDDEEYIFDFYFNEELGCYSFWTKWAPTYYTLVTLVKDFPALDFELWYEELGMGIFGIYNSEKGEIHDTFLVDDEIDLVEPVDEDYTEWTYNGETYECREEALNIILDLKRKNCNA